MKSLTDAQRTRNQRILMDLCLIAAAVAALLFDVLEWFDQYEVKVKQVST